MNTACRETCEGILYSLDYFVFSYYENYRKMSATSPFAEALVSTQLKRATLGENCCFVLFVLFWVFFFFYNVKKNVIILS